MSRQAAQLIWCVWRKCLLCFRAVPMSVWWRLCVFTHSVSRWVPTCYSDCICLSLSLSVFSHCCCHSSSSPPLSFCFPFFVVVCLPSPIPSPSPASSLSLALHFSSSLTLSLCFPSERCWRLALRPHSSLWQLQLPDKRKQIPQQELDINGLRCFSSVMPFFVKFTFWVGALT